jgi:mannose-6-phosphate isomerase-like protein (cupin superfamily)
MYKRIEELKTQTNLNNEGKERMFKTNLADFEKWNPMATLFSLIQVKPGEEVNYHMHVGDSEAYFFLSGKGVYNDNGNEVEIESGMVTFTASGEGHSVKNTGDNMLSFIALILKDK